MSGPTRRRLLAAAGASLAAAGCTTLRGTATGEPTSIEPSPDGAATGSADAAVAEPYAAVYQETIGSVVTVRVYDAYGRGGGSGFVRGDGTVVTNEHVVDGAEEIRLAFNEGEWTTAELLGGDAYADLAVLEPAERPAYAEALSLRRADPSIGTRVMALGNPYQLEASASSGIVSGVDRSLEGANDFPIPDAIQTDAAVNPGNSGGPLVDLDGEVVGVITAGGGENIGFAISAPLTRRIVPELVETGSYTHPYIGVRLLTVSPTVADVNELGLEDPRGVLVAEVVEDGPAAGVLEASTDSEQVRGVTYPVGGDVILALDGTPTPTLEALSSYVALEKAPGDTMTMEVLRNGERTSLQLTLGERPPPP